MNTPEITRTAHTESHWVFHLDDGQKFVVGKYAVKDGIEEGVQTEEEAIEIMRVNIAELEA